MNTKRSVIISICIALLILVFVFILLLFSNKNSISLNIINANLEVENIKLGMLEQEVIDYWGTGEYIYGFGGHGRTYKQKGVTINFLGDVDNDFYGKVGGLVLSNPIYSILTINVGEDREFGIRILESNGFTVADYSKDIYVNGEFSIALHGGITISLIQIWFNDKDLMDRNY